MHKCVVSELEDLGPDITTLGAVHTKYVVQRWPQPPRGWPDARHARSIGIAAPCLIDRVYDMNNGLILG